MYYISFCVNRSHPMSGFYHNPIQFNKIILKAFLFSALPMIFQMNCRDEMLLERDRNLHNMYNMVHYMMEVNLCFFI